MASKAAFVGANIVMGPGCDKRSTRPAALISDTSVVNSGWNTMRSSTEHSGVQAPNGAWSARLGGWSRGGWSSCGGTIR